MHEMFATQQQLLTSLQAQLLENEKKINQLLKLVDALHAHLNQTTNTPPG